MKKALFVMAVAALVLFNACNPVEKNHAYYLQNATKGWQMVSVKSVPAYQLESGVSLDELFANGDYEHQTGYFYSYEKDDIVIFGENGVETINPGTLVPEEGAYTQTVTTSYRVDEDNSMLYFQMPWEYNDDFTAFDEEVEKCSISACDKDQLILIYTRNDDENPAKAQNTFTITYEPAK
ncbi:MAG: hypothetical protein IKQ75_01665 [Bacteroidales bacterium]|nr:hypothetical protein [Bacteroidales bacterium]MBR6160556.1 hypothetical protein [Bacteroidales bacterium]